MPKDKKSKKAKPATKAARTQKKRTAPKDKVPATVENQAMKSPGPIGKWK